MKKQFGHWLSILNQHKYETRGFTLDLTSLTDVELINLKTVTANFLDFAPAMFPVIHQKHHAELRRTISYLTELSELQGEAWRRKQQEYQMRLKNTKSWVQEHTTNN